MEESAMPIRRLTKADHPQSHGAFKPVGHVMVALRDEELASATARALLEAGFEDEDILHYSAGEERAEMESMIDHASDFAGFGYEITLMRRYRTLAREGCSWLLVYAPDEAHTRRVADVARRNGALVAVKYNRLLIEDLI
jgi:hypothetical protein